MLKSYDKVYRRYILTIAIVTLIFSVVRIIQTQPPSIFKSRYFATLLFAFYIVINYSRYYFKFLKSHYKSIRNKYPTGEVPFFFYKEGFKTTNSYTYSQITYVNIAKNICIVYMSDRFAIICKHSFTKGNFDEFIMLLKEKSPNAVWKSTEK